VNDWVVQCLADILNTAVDRPVMTESTALGAAYLAALQVGLFNDLSDVQANWQCERHFEPQLTKERRESLVDGWHAAVQRVRS